jgi:hypothetical protein
MFAPLVVVGALVSGCATVEDVQRAQATADEALMRADRAGASANAAMAAAQSAQQTANAAQAEAQNATRLAGQASSEAAAARAEAVRIEQEQLVVARGERG